MTISYGPEEVTGDPLTVGNDGVTTLGRRWEFTTTAVVSLPTAYTDFTAALSLVGVGETYAGLYIEKIVVNRESDSPRHFIGTIAYTNSRELETNPLLEPSRVTFSSEFYQVPVFRDRYGQAVVTKSGEYPEGLFEDAVQTNITITKNVLTIPGWFITSQGAVNSVPFSVKGLSFAAEKVRLSSVSASDEFTRNGFTFYKLSFTLSYRMSGWKTEFMNRGFYRKLSASGTIRVPIVDANVEKITTPWPLDINGLQIDNPTISNIIILSFDTKPAFDFSILPLT